MDVSEIRTLRHKRHLLVTNLIVDNDVIQHLLRLKLMTRKMVASIQDEPSNMLKMAKYLDLLEGGSTGLGKNVFNRFCQFLLDRFPPIHDELRVELMAVRGELQIETYMREEARILVQREFNDMKRLKDIEKREIEDLVATRMQVHKEIWAREIGEATRQMQKENVDDMTRKEFISKMADQLDKFIRISDTDGTLASRPQKEAIEARCDIKGTKLTLATMRQVIEDVDVVKELSLKNMETRRSALEEKSRALKVIGASTTTLTRLDEEVAAVLDPLEGEEKDLEAQLTLLQHQAEEQRKKLSELEQTRREEEEELDERIRIQKDLFQTTHQSSQTDRSEMFRLQRLLARVMEHLWRLQSKSTMLYRGRSIGYANSDVLERVRALRATVPSRPTAAGSQQQQQLLSKTTPRRVIYSRSLDRRQPLLSQRSTI